MNNVEVVPEQAIPTDNWKANPKAYRRANKPHDSPESAESEIRAFQAGVEKLRLKHRIRTLSVTGSMTCKQDDKPQRVLWTFSFGDLFEVPELVARASASAHDLVISHMRRIEDSLSAEFREEFKD